MGLLFPLYLLGFAAIAAPVILHLTRRTPKEQVPFSSLMFLREAPLRLKRRSRLEQLFLLALRCLALLFLALAFARPMWQGQDAAADQASAKRVLYLLDTSASMGAEGQLDRARELLLADAAQLQPYDRAAVVAFNDQMNPLLDFDTWTQGGVEAALKKFGETSPNAEGGSRLGLALVQAANDLQDLTEQASSKGLQEIVVISDMQEGLLLDELYAFEWPDHLHVRLLPVPAASANNASIQWVRNPGDASFDEKHPTPWIRMSNQAGADQTLLQLAWADAPDQAISLNVPAGQSKVIKAPPTVTGLPGKELILSGDDLAYDNHLFMAPLVDRQINVLFIGTGDEKDAEQPYYFLRRALLDTRVFTPVITVRRGSENLADIDTSAIDFCVITEAMTDATPITAWIESGGTAVYMVREGDDGDTLAQLTGAPVKLTEASVKEFALMGHLDLKHPWLKPFTDAQFGDFSKIHFWHYRKVEGSSAKILARFDGADPAMMEDSLGEGRLVTLTSGWHPGDSQLALSSRFVPLLYSLLEHGQTGTGGRMNLFTTRAAVPVPAGATRVVDPNGTSIPLKTGQRIFNATQQVGIYRFEGAELDVPFAVNLPPSESRVAPLPEKERSQLTTLGQEANADESEAAAGKHEVENRQKLWRWLIVGLWAALIVETGIAGRRVRPVDPSPTVESTA